MFTLVQDVALRALASLAETRDNETGNHILRTQSYVLALGTVLAQQPRFSEALAPERLRLIGKAAPLHDIGKVGIPDHILLKPGKLTPEEWDIMRTHAQLGADAINRALHDAQQSEEGQENVQFEFLEVARDIAAHHHERWNGSGYPDGLQGDAIPVSARLMALADVYDALISRRVYKDPFPREEVAHIIKQERGQHFDPDIVDAFCTCQTQFEEIAERFCDESAAK